jgi:flagellar operon protein
MSFGNGMKINNYQRPMNLIEIANRNNHADEIEKSGEKSFKEMFSQELATDRSLSFSKHAHQRLYSRGITITEEKLNAIADAVDKAEEKGSRETLILSDETAFVVSIKNRTVITAFDKENLREGVVTSIDSAVVI